MKKHIISTLAIIMCTLMVPLTFLKNPVHAEGPALSVNPSVTAAALAQKLVGKGIAISNVKFQGAEAAKGIFSGGTGIIGFEEGIILSTGKAADVIGPNKSKATSTNNGTNGDADLEKLMNNAKTYDAAVLEFDFVPQSDTISFQYVLASDEYNEYLNYADVFGFFVNGKNAALLPTDPPEPVSIGTVNGVKNSEYYINNDVGIGKLNTEMDGMTIVLSIQSNVKKGELNHIKLAIADYNDAIYDSNVFIKAGSLSGDAAKPGTLGFGKVSYSIDKDIVHASIAVNRVNGTDGSVGAKWICDNKKVIENQGIISFNDSQSSNKLEVSYPYGETANITLNSPIGGAKIDPELNSIHLYSPVYITNVTSSKENGLYKAGEKINTEVTFNGNVYDKITPKLVNSPSQIPELLLNSGSKAKYSSGFGTKTLTFSYTVNQKDFSKDLDYKDINSLTGLMLDASGMPVLLTLPAVGSKDSISGSKDIVIDAVPPVINLNGEEKIIVEQNKNYTEPGAKAEDNLDGDITNNIIISGIVKSSTPGEYLIHYSVTDKAGNATNATRTVVVKQALPQTGSTIDTSILLTIGLLVILLGLYQLKKAYKQN